MESFFLWSWHNLVKPVFWFQPCFYALHGWLATEMAIWLLFHPYEAKYIPGTRLQIPLTPGILPRGRANLSQSIADTVTRTLLTEADLHQQAEKLLTEATIIRCMDAIIDSIAREMHNKEQIRQIYRYGVEVLPDMLSQMTTGFIEQLENDRSGKIHKLINEACRHALGRIQLSYPQAELMAGVLFSTLLTPHYLRQLLVEGLTESNIQRIEAGVSHQVGGLKGLLVKFMGIEQTLSRLRDFCEHQPQEAEAHITEVLDRMEVRERIAERISNFRFETLSAETQEAVTGYMSAILVDSLADYRPEMTEMVSAWSGAGSRMLINRLLQFNLKTWIQEKRPTLKTELARFILRYLDRELKNLLTRAWPVVNLGQMIVEKLEQFSNAELEGIIYGICRRELRWLAILGAFLGFWLGLMSNLINFWLQSV